MAESDEEEMFAKLEADDSLGGFREQRMQQLSEHMRQVHKYKSMGHGSYEACVDEREILALTSAPKRSMVHFFHEDFHRCHLLHEHLAKLAQTHYETKFTCIRVQDAPFLVDRLHIQVLPALLLFDQGHCIDRVIGFDSVGDGGDHFATQQLEARLLRASIIDRVDAG